ncbi:MBL fold metallo-hydrolase [Asanoa iriomotensis]|uniref:MBL fold metallo-hydrolase n=1 Tax=Asanoa iriomotensis TaxID=234613 RepID=A0ABQ4C3Z6_9ACTN|nr:MBL fold metallo-hydrolase [Asanoa iriomotensis]GIF57479.1 MBL fold metallo-hydrolase [Asanoa iriomotensis]
MTAQAPALPPVERVLPGVWAIPLPMTGTGLAYVRVYTIEADDGFYLVDAGWPSPAALDLLAAGFAAAGASLADLRGVLVTHIHPDHYGLAAHIRKATGAWVALHPADAAIIEDRYGVDGNRVALTRQWLRAAGVPDGRVTELTTAMLAGPGDIEICLPDLELEHGERAPIPGRELVAVHSPGHTPGHLMFDLPAEGAVFAGDNLLSRATPNISYGPHTDPDPLSDYLHSLLAVADLGPRAAFPAHQQFIADAAGRAKELVNHHDERLQEVLMVLLRGAETVYDVCGELTWRHRLDRLPTYLVRAALGETHAHLLRLATIGAATVSPGPPQRWAAVPVAEAP